jgi:RNA polymerase sigma factor (sigma-70 family)
MEGDDHIAGHVGAAWRIAVQYSVAYHSPLDELVSAAYEGLVRAARAFDPARDRKFWGYAKHRVRGIVMDTIEARTRRCLPLVSFESVRLQSEMSIPDPLLWRAIWRTLDRMDGARRVLTRRSPSRHAVIKLYYFEGLSMEEIGERLGCEKSRVAQIHKEAIAGLALQLWGIRLSPGR